MRIKKNLILAASFIVLVGCSSPKEDSSSMSSVEESSEIQSSSVEESSSSLESSSVLSSSVQKAERNVSGIQSEFFKSAESVSISLSLTNEAMHLLSKYQGDQDTYWHKYDDIYFPADFVCTIGEEEYVYNDVGVRMKGATSRKEFASSSGNIYDTCHFKISFKCTFDDYFYDLPLFSQFKHTWTASEKTKRDNRKFFGMDKLDLKYLPRNEVNFRGQTYKSYNQEFYSYETFNSNGVLAPYARWVNLSLSSESQTKTFKYEAVEPIDKKFLKRAFGENKGDLYKCTQVLSTSDHMTNPWGGTFDMRGTKYSAVYANLTLDDAVERIYDEETGYAIGERIANGKIGVEDNYNNYHPVYSLKTNDDAGEGSDFSKMANFMNVLYSVRKKGAPYSLLESVLDVDQFLSYAAASYVLGNYDDMRNNSNNYYIYFRKSDSKAVFIPYDFDYSLGLTKSEQNYVLMTTGGMYTALTSNGQTNNTSIYYDTIISNTSLSYYDSGDVTQKSLQNTYKTKIKAITANGFLDYSNYVSYVSSLPDSTTSENEEMILVEQYMTAKKATIDAVA